MNLKVLQYHLARVGLFDSYFTVLLVSLRVGRSTTEEALPVKQHVVRGSRSVSPQPRVTHESRARVSKLVSFFALWNGGRVLPTKQPVQMSLSTQLYDFAPT